jgi:hypothetical protein
MFFGGGSPVPGVVKEIAALKLRGVSTRFIDDHTVEVTQRTTGSKRIKTLSEPGEGQIRRYASVHQIPILEIDPTTLDTNRWTGWYKHFAQVRLANDFGCPPVVADFDHNRKAEVYGCAASGEFFDDPVYQVDSVGSVRFLYYFNPYVGIAGFTTNVDQDSLQEVTYKYGDSLYFFEQPTRSSLPKNRKFAYGEDEYSGTGIGQFEVCAHLNGDSSMDLVHRGSVLDSAAPGGFTEMTCVAKYDPSVPNFQKVWKTQLHYPESQVGGYDAGDYDGDGRMKFLACAIYGQVFVVKNTGDDQYALSWRDSLPLVNLFYQTSGDVDNDGKREFFVGATMSDGNWTVVYEADSIDHYAPVFVFHLLSGGSLDEPTYLCTDVDGDGIPDLVILSGGDLYIFRSNGPASYYLWYFKQNDYAESVQIYDFNRDGKMDVLVSNDSLAGGGSLFMYSDIYTATSLVTAVPSVRTLPQRYALHQNYPNPFNPTTTIRYEVPKRSEVSLRIYDILGREVSTLFDGVRQPGGYSAIWNGAGFASGVYFCRMTTSGYSETIKLVKLQ